MADSDLQQYNGAQAFPSRTDVGTNADTFLIPLDTKIITADDNGTDSSPVNKSLQRIKGYYLGLRAAVLGDFAGAVRKTVKSVEADGTGGNTSTLPVGSILATGDITSTTGTIQALGNVLALIGNMIASTGKIEASAGALYSGPSAGPKNAEFWNAWVKFIGTGTTSLDANPPQGTSIKNQMRATNIPKCSAFVKMDVLNVIASFKGYGIASVSVAATSGAVQAAGGPAFGYLIQFVDAFDNAFGYTVELTHCARTVGIAVAAGLDMAEDFDQRATTQTVVFFSGGANPSLAPLSFSISITGQQTT